MLKLEPAAATKLVGVKPLNSVIHLDMEKTLVAVFALVLLLPVLFTISTEHFLSIGSNYVFFVEAFGQASCGC